VVGDLFCFGHCKFVPGPLSFLKLGPILLLLVPFNSSSLPTTHLESRPFPLFYPLYLAPGTDFSLEKKIFPTFFFPFYQPPIPRNYPIPYWNKGFVATLPR